MEYRNILRWYLNKASLSDHEKNLAEGFFEKLDSESNSEEGDPFNIIRRMEHESGSRMVEKLSELDDCLLRYVLIKSLNPEIANELAVLIKIATKIDPNHDPVSIKMLEMKKDKNIDQILIKRGIPSDINAKPS